MLISDRETVTVLNADGLQYSNGRGKHHYTTCEPSGVYKLKW